MIIYLTQTLTQMRKGTERSGENGDSNRSVKAGHKRAKWGKKVTIKLWDAAHNPEVVGSNPSPATRQKHLISKEIGCFSYFCAQMAVDEDCLRIGRIRF